MSTLQRALYSGPGRFRAVLAFDIAGPEGRETRKKAIESAAALLKELESSDLNDKPLRVLVALAPRVLESHEAWPQLATEYVEIGNFRFAQPAVLVQIAAETEDERTYALRLIQRVFRGSLKLREECYGGRHLLSREAFGYREASWEEVSFVPESKAVPGVSWLLYQRCTQNIQGFFAIDPKEQDRTVGRTRESPPETIPTPGSHIEVARRHTTEGGKTTVQRRSFSYETYTDAGLAFLAAAAHSAHLKKALDALNGDPIRGFIRLETGGLYVVPPSSSWLAPDVHLEALTGDARPRPERPFFPAHPLLLYEVTPKSREFFFRAFHANKDNFDEGETLRGDLQLMAKGLAKLIYGAHLNPEGTFYRFLQRAFAWDNSESFVTPEIARTIEELRRAKRDGEPPERLNALRARIREALATTENLWKLAGDLAQTTTLDLFADLLCDDAEFIAGSDAEKKEDYETLMELCLAATDESRRLNEAAGDYLSIMV